MKRAELEYYHKLKNKIDQQASRLLSKLNLFLSFFWLLAKYCMSVYTMYSNVHCTIQELKKILASTQIYYYVQNHCTFHSEEKLVNLERRKERTLFVFLNSEIYLWNCRSCPSCIMYIFQFNIRSIPCNIYSFFSYSN